MQIENWPIARVRPYPNNPRVLRNAAEKVAASIREFGWRQPIVVDETGEVIVGHSRLAAAQLLKLDTVPVHVARGLSQDQVRALRIADNKTATFAGWDEAKLADELQAIMAGLGDVTSTGFSQAEFDAIEMQARAALDALQVQPIAPAVAAPVPAAGQAEPVADQPEELGDVDAGGSADEPASPVPASPRAEELVPLTVLMPLGHRAVVFDAIAKAKQAHGLATTAEALLVVARSYVDA